jgi:hypothetical protein
MIDTYLGLPNYFTSLYFWLSLVIAIVLGVYTAVKMEG